MHYQNFNPSGADFARAQALDISDGLSGKWSDILQVLTPHAHTFREMTATVKDGQICIACGFKRYYLLSDQVEACSCEHRECGYHKHDCPQLYPKACVKPEPAVCDDPCILICPACCDDIVKVKLGEKVPVWHTCGGFLEAAICTECDALAVVLAEGSDYDRASHNYLFWREPRCYAHGRQ